MLPKSPQRQQAMWSVKPLANMDLRFQKRTSVRMEIFREKEENEGRESKNGQTAVWQILWDVVEGWWCFHCWHQHKFSWRGSPCPAWAQHWETGEEILQAAREWNQRAGAPRPLTHWTPRWPHNSLWFSHTHTHTQRYMHSHTHNSHIYSPRSSVIHSKMCANKTTHIHHFQDHLGSMLITLCLPCLIYLKAVHLFLPSDKQCLSLCSSWGWHILACIRTVRRSVVDERFNEPCLRSLIKTWQTHTLTHTLICVCHTEHVCTHTHMQTRAVWVNDDVISPDILEMSGARKWGYASCHLQPLSVNVCMCEHTMPSKLLETVQWTWWSLYSMPQWVGFPPQLLRKEAHTQWRP